MDDDMDLIYHPVKNRPMNVAVFASGGGNNFLTAIDTARSSRGKIRICLLVADRIGIPAIVIAQSHRIPVIAKDFEKECGVWKICKNDSVKAQHYHAAGERFHDEILEQILAYQRVMKEAIDLVVLSYHRLIRGKLLTYFTHRMVNQHPADLTVMRNPKHKQRKYVGLSPVFDALRDGNRRTRTTNFLVREGCDNGEILCSGPWVDYQGDLPVTRNSSLEHEIRQKKLSDRPCLRFVLLGISEGHFGIHRTRHHADGSNVIMYNERPLPYGGFEISKNTTASNLL